MTGRRIHVRSTKYDGSPHWEFDCWSVYEQGPLVVAMNFAGQELQTWNGPWVTPYHTRNHFWSDRWYNVMRLERPQGGGLEGWYCNVTTPALFDGEHLHYVDLDLDVIVDAALQPRVMDEDEFLENGRRMGYPPDVVEQARRAVDELLKLVHNATFPFEPVLDQAAAP
jgi:protein associated with RNAse G/E